MEIPPVRKDSPSDPWEQLLSQDAFSGLKAILEHLSRDAARRLGALRLDSYKELLASLGYKLELVTQIHVLDAFSRVGSEGGIKAVIPFYDTVTHRSFPTLVNLNSSVTTTPAAAEYFDQMLLALRNQARGAGQKAAISSAT